MHRIWSFQFLLLILSSFRSQHEHVNSLHFDRPFPAVFNFGDSHSDTGEVVAGLGRRLAPPNGQTFFRKPAGRICDGRLIVDFLMEAMGLPFLNPYLNAIGAPSFRQGCNFAAAGCTVLPATASSVCPFSFGIQVNQFLRFKDQVLELHLETKEVDKYIPAEDYFSKGLYMFDIGQNDLANFFDAVSPADMLAAVLSILAELEAGIEKLYEQGARNFWIHNSGPHGCLPACIAISTTDASTLDELGCVSKANQESQIFNLHLYKLTTKLRRRHSNANFTYVDIFSIKLDLIANYSHYGFEEPIMACCGYGGAPLNYDSRISCGATMVLDGRSVVAGACSDSSKHVNWDGVHFTEAANRHVSSQILTGKFSDPPFSLLGHGYFSS